MNDFVRSFRDLATLAHENAVLKGFWRRRDAIEAACFHVSPDLGFDARKAIDSQLRELIISEISEACEGDRKDLRDDKIPEFSMVEAELADAIIRIMDYSTARSLRVAEAVVAKMEPYGNLETYSDDPRDISGYEYDAFLASYEEIIDAAVARLRDNRFALFVVANFRDKRSGLYHDFVGDTVRIFERAGLGFYNEAVLVTVCGSAPIRAANIFESGRKLVRTHQNVVMFVKGDWRAAARAARRENEELEIAKEFQ